MAVKLIISFSQEEKEIQKFTDKAREVKVIAQKAERTISLMSAFFNFSIFGFYTYSFLIASIFYQYEIINSQTGVVYSAGDLLTVLQACITGFMVFRGVIPNL